MRLPENGTAGSPTVVECCSFPAEPLSNHVRNSQRIHSPMAPLLALLPSLQRRSRHRGVWLRDRKSTRLNSSHGYISYAVFCLKKKTTTSKHKSNTSTTIH